MMFKAFLYLLLVAGAALGLAWFADRPGVLTLQWLGYEMETSVFVAAVAVFGVVTLLLLAIGLLVYLISSPKRMARYMRERRRIRGYDALRKGMFAVGAGDEASAARFAGEARRNLPNEPLTKLLRAQSAQLSGDRGTARRIFETLADEGDTQLLGLRGLFLEANYEGHAVAATQFAERAVSLNPSLPWAVHALFDMQCKARDWQGALETLAVARVHKHFGRKVLDRRRAVLLTAQAKELQDSQSTKALELALEAHRLAPSLIPAANIAGRILAGQGASYKAARVIARSWQAMPHPDLAIAYAYARPGDSPRDRLGRVKALVALTPSHPEARVALAVAASDAHEWEEARAALEPLLATNPTARVCALMARIEGSQKRDAGRVREWLARAVRASRDPVWMADGVVAEEWAPISPVNGRLDAFEWRTPPDPTKGGADALLEDMAALSRELEAVAHTPEVSVIAETQREPGPQASAPERSQALEPQILEPQILGRQVSGRQVSERQLPERQVPEQQRLDQTPIDVTPRAEPSVAVTVQPAPVRATPKPPAAEPKPAAMAPALHREQMDESAPDRRATEAASGVAAKNNAAKTVDVDRRILPLDTENPRAASAAAKASPPSSGVPPVPAPGRRAEPKIFVADRAPDDPGPEPADPDDAQTPLGRFLSTMKQQTT